MLKGHFNSTCKQKVEVESWKFNLRIYTQRHVACMYAYKLCLSIHTILTKKKETKEKKEERERERGRKIMEGLYDSPLG